MKKFLFSLTSAATLLLTVDVYEAEAAQFEYRGFVNNAFSEEIITLTIQPFPIGDIADDADLDTLAIEGLTGIGEESISLSELNLFDSDRDTYNFVFFDYQVKQFDTISTGGNPFISVDYTNDPVFYFDSGNLVGIDLDTEPIGFGFGDCRSFPCSFQFGTFRNEIRKDTITRYYEATFREIENPFSEPTETESNFVVEETITFTTIEPIPLNPDEPVASVPEPFSIFGLGALVAFSTGLKSKLNRS